MTDPDLTAVLDMHLLLQLGGRLKGLRVAQGLTTTEIAQRVGITRNTLRAIESGDPATSLGSYLRVMSALGVSGDLALLATGVVQQPVASAASAAGTSHTPRTARTARTTGAASAVGRGARPGEAPVVEVRVSAGRSRHAVQDLQSLLLHEAALRQLKADPSLLGRARDALLSWSAGAAEGVREHSRSAPLWDEWLEILEQRAWRKVLARTQHAQQLRQASPLLTVLTPKARQAVLAQVAELKRGVTLLPAGARHDWPAEAAPSAATPDLPSPAPDLSKGVA